MKQLYKTIEVKDTKDLNSIVERGKFICNLEKRIEEEFENYYNNINKNDYNNIVLGRSGFLEIGFNPRKTKYIFKLFKIENNERKEILEQMNLYINFK